MKRAVVLIVQRVAAPGLIVLTDVFPGAQKTFRAYDVLTSARLLADVLELLAKYAAEDDQR